MSRSDNFFVVVAAEIMYKDVDRLVSMMGLGDENQMSKIEGLENLTNLEELTFRYNNFAFNTLKREEAISYFAKNKNLKRLNGKKFHETDK